MSDAHNEDGAQPAASTVGARPRNDQESVRREATRRAEHLAARLQSWFSGGVRASLERAGGNVGEVSGTHRLTCVWSRDDVVFAELDGHIVLGIAGAGRLEITEDRFEIVEFTDGRVDWLDEGESLEHRGEEFARGPISFTRAPVFTRSSQIESPAAFEAYGHETDSLVH